MKNWKQFAALGGIIAVLGGVAWWDDWQTKKDADNDSAKNRLLAFDVSDVTEFTVTARGLDGRPGESVLLKKDGADWAIAAPMAAKADQQAVANFLKGVADYKFERAIEANGKPLKDFGLDTDALKVSLVLGGKDPGQKAIRIGTKAPVGYSVYSQVEGDSRILLGSQYLESSSNKSMRDFRDKHLAKIDEAKLASLTLKRRDFKDLTLAKKTGIFHVTDGANTYPADQTEVSALVNAVNETLGTDFDDAPVAENVKIAMDSGHRLFELSWNSEGGPVQSISVGNVDGKFWVATDPNTLAIEVAGAFHDKLRKTIGDFRNRKIFSFSGERIAKVDFDGQLYEAVKGEWYAAADVAAAMNKKEGAETPKAMGQIRALVVDLEFAKTLDFPNAGDSAIAAILADAPKHKLVLTPTEAEAGAITIQAWTKPGTDHYLLKHSGSGEVFEVSKDIFEPKQAANQSDEGFRPPVDTSAGDADDQHGAG